MKCREINLQKFFLLNQFGRPSSLWWKVHYQKNNIKLSKSLTGNSTQRSQNADNFIAFSRRWTERRLPRWPKHTKEESDAKKLRVCLRLILGNTFIFQALWMMFARCQQQREQLSALNRVFFRWRRRRWPPTVAQGQWQLWWSITTATTTICINFPLRNFQKWVNEWGEFARAWDQSGDDDCGESTNFDECSRESDDLTEGLWKVLHVRLMNQSEQLYEYEVLQIWNEQNNRKWRKCDSNHWI